ncbi:glycosyltransferase family 1 protein [Patescibacteria group bacterium]|nr:glycosyltransferase family 1 protein [Patescibacteria group bacterium]
MRIAVDIRSLLSPTGRGVSHYASSLLSEMVTRHPADTWMLFSSGRRRPKLPAVLRDTTRLRHVNLPNKVMNGLLATGATTLERYVGPVDVWFAPNLGFVPVPETTPLVVTVHDLSFEVAPHYFSTKDRLWHKAVRPRKLLQRANKVIAISNETAKELKQHYGLPASKITVISSAIDSVYGKKISVTERDRVRQKYGLSKPYFLYLGAIEPRKNIPTLLSAYRLARQQGVTAELVLAGTGKKVKETEGVRALGYVDEADKPALYHDAVALTLISRHEGFGFPPLEALACGTPSIVSDLSIFQETLGKAAWPVPVGDPAAIADALVQLERDKRLCQNLVKRGQPLLKRYTWKRAASETYNVLKEVSRAR